MGAQVDKYSYRVSWSDEDEEYVGQCAEFPSLSWLGESPVTALQGIQDVVADVVLDLESNNETVPEPLSLRQFSGRFMVRVPPSLHRELAIRAAEEGVSINRFVSARLAR